PRVDKGVAWGLLARIYLNAQVYTGTPRWADAKDAATKVIGFGYGLAANYRELFMGDNGENADTRKELIYAVAYDKDKTQSHGGTSFLVNAALSGDDSDAKTLTGSDGWGGIRTTFEYAQKFRVSNPDYLTGDFDCNDKRALFYIKGREETMKDLYTFIQGWSCIKYSKHNSDGTINGGNFNSADYPMMRLAEMYLIYAEATLRAAGGTSGTDATALAYLNDLRTRAFKTPETPLGSYDLNYIIEERARELMWEGHRRTDLIRYGLYTSGDYLWTWKGGTIQGIALNNRYNLCPYPVDEIRMNTNLTPTAGYTY
ncbi:MAG: RagB/SusD family nutrient uptake outer membrane protein, partial [Dysgonamonadaceae bacterium]|nr:RagB/SusD family nutrient uptake outer membrane protein [Dysgonamonadaceae bacterium]